MDEQIEKSFEAATKILFGKSLHSMQNYGKWLEANHRPAKKHKSALSNQMVYDPPLVFYAPASKKAVKQGEALELGKLSLSHEEAKALNLSNFAQKTAKMRHHTSDAITGTNTMMEECSLYIDSSYCFQVYSTVESKFCGYSFWPRNSEYMYGVDCVFNSKFCLKCYNSVNLTRCFEVSHSANSSDCYFCHNLDACSECMFCTNAKSLRYAIFNHEVGKEQYLRVKKMVLAEIAQKLEKDKKLDINIFNIGCGRKK